MSAKKAKAPPVEVWTLSGSSSTGPAVQRIEGAKMGAQMVTLPGGQRWAIEGYSLGDSYYTSAKACAIREGELARKQVKDLRHRLACAEAAVVACDAALAAAEA